MPKAVILFYHWSLSPVLQHSNNVIFVWLRKKKKGLGSLTPSAKLESQRANLNKENRNREKRNIKRGPKLCNVISSFSYGVFIWLCNGAAINTYKQCFQFWSSISSKTCSLSSVNIWSEAWQPRFLILHWPSRMSLTLPLPHPHRYFHHFKLHSPFYSSLRRANTAPRLYKTKDFFKILFD